MAVMQAGVMSFFFAIAVATPSLRGADLPGTGTSTDSSDQASELVLANFTTRNNATTSAPERSLKKEKKYDSWFSYYPGVSDKGLRDDRDTKDVPDAYRRASSSSDWVKGVVSYNNWDGGAVYYWHSVTSYEDAEYLLVATGNDALYIDRAKEISSPHDGMSRKRKVWFGVKGGSGWVLSLQPNDGEKWGLPSRTCTKFVPKSRSSRWSTSCWGISAR